MARLVGELSAKAAALDGKVVASNAVDMRTWLGCTSVGKVGQSSIFAFNGRDLCLQRVGERVWGRCAKELRWSGQALSVSAAFIIPPRGLYPLASGGASTLAATTCATLC